MSSCYRTSLFSTMWTESRNHLGWSVYRQNMGYCKSWRGANPGWVTNGWEDIPLSLHGRRVRICLSQITCLETGTRNLVRWFLAVKVGALYTSRTLNQSLSLHRSHLFFSPMLPLFLSHRLQPLLSCRTPRELHLPYSTHPAQSTDLCQGSPDSSGNFLPLPTQDWEWKSSTSVHIFGSNAGRRRHYEHSQAPGPCVAISALMARRWTERCQRRQNPRLPQKCLCCSCSYDTCAAQHMAPSARSLDLRTMGLILWIKKMMGTKSRLILLNCTDYQNAFVY